MVRPRGSVDKTKRKVRTQWTLEQITTLTELYPTTTNAKLAEILNKSVDSVKTRARTLGLKKA